ncbi:flagellar biosynthetic protein FliO [Salinicola endophyticus]|uniref:Flagellar protein n=1 Tax=Salinicola endophyticus TaxID=1949083 RepID=A0ABY8FME0_9GAMM|nr:flagellar biosynthetic protein FliO [Salinicola endophyticus]WFF42833.1 flagellar biosynthetic protein FliO [Salinicola endophyticus]
MKEDVVRQAEPLVGGTSNDIGLLMMGKTAVSLLVVIAIILLCTWLLKRLGTQRRGGGKHLRVVASTSVGQRERVVIVEVENRWLVLGVGGGQVTKLDTLDSPPMPPPAPERPAGPPLTGSFASRLRQAMQHNLRQSLKPRQRREDEP